ncbi:DUF1561 family protein [Helicobacter macacae]|uniref:Uncharacterized protein n=1 Tax=Helicobacter macacae MIT 99-5501 TaxID=1357400 RepID=V8CCP6_9HELI|nr:DUF1561 family protein [Helicobacter macacae]ETD24795.1 hypothetical protein HMPREF2086_00129 [Helicobacter macacae MIT 99-5501]
MPLQTIKFIIASITSIISMASVLFALLISLSQSLLALHSPQASPQTPPQNPPQNPPKNLPQNLVNNERYIESKLDSISLKAPKNMPKNSKLLKTRKLKILDTTPKTPKSTLAIAKKSTQKSKPLTTTPNLTSPLSLNNVFDFSLESWVSRLAQIASSTDGSAFHQGVCGTCLLHSYEIVAEILFYGNTPPTQGGYFFDTAPNVNPFLSFRARHSLLYDTLDDIAEYYVLPADDVSQRFANSVRLSYASAISLLPQFDWRFVGYGVEPDDVGRLLEGVLASRVGTLYVVSMIHYQEGRGLGQHGVVLVRASGGVRVLATNIINATPQEIANIARLNTDFYELTNAIANTMGAGTQIAALGLVEVSGRYALPFASALSFSDCSGEGEGMRGNARIPTASALNQCASGRCNQ